MGDGKEQHLNADNKILLVDSSGWNVTECSSLTCFTVMYCDVHLLFMNITYMVPFSNVTYMVPFSNVTYMVLLVNIVYKERNSRTHSVRLSEVS